MASTYLEKDAIISLDGTYRYQLRRKWADGKPAIVWCMLNPSTADALEDDATIRRIVSFSARRGYGRLEVVNLWALRATNPDALQYHPDPVGQLNATAISQVLADPEVTMAVCAWGANLRRICPRPAMSLHFINTAHRNGVPTMCLGRTKEGYPKHPVRLSGETELVPYP